MLKDAVDVSSAIIGTVECCRDKGIHMNDGNRNIVDDREKDKFLQITVLSTTPPCHFKA